MAVAVGAVAPRGEVGLVVLVVREGKDGVLVVLRTRERSSCIRAPRRGTGGVRIAGSRVGRDVWVVRDLGGRGGVVGGGMVVVVVCGWFGLFNLFALTCSNVNRVSAYPA